MTVHVIHADFKTIDFASMGIDHVITDPPYSGYTHSHAHSTGTNGRGPVQRDFGFEPLRPEDREACARIIAKVPRWSVVFSDFAKAADELDGDPEAQAQAGHFLLEGDCAWRFSCVHLGAEWIRFIPWIRWSQPQITGDRPPTGAEAVLHFHAKGKKRWNGPGNLTHYDTKSLRGNDKHPTEKPLGLMLDIVSWFTEPGEAILDPFAGAGTTGLAAALLGRDAVLVEKSEQWAVRAEARCAGDVSERDIASARAWVERTTLQAGAEIAAKTTTEPAKRRAEHRVADAHRVAEALP